MPIAAIEIDFTGPATVAAGGVSGNFTLTPTALFTGNVVINDSGAGGSFTPAVLSWASSTATKTFVYNAPNVAGVKTITPVPNIGSGGACVPTSLPITVLGAQPPQHLYQFPQFAGVPPFQILRSNDQIPAANMPYVPPTLTSRGTTEAASGTAVGIPAGTGYILMGPIQTPVREGLKQIVSVQGSGPFNLDYQFTTDGGVTWYNGDQVPSTTTAADGTGMTNQAHIKVSPGFQWQVVVWNTGGSSITVNFERHLVKRGKWGK